MADSSQIRVSYSINSITTATVPGTMALLVLYPAIFGAAEVVESSFGAPIFLYKNLVTSLSCGANISYPIIYPVNMSFQFSPLVDHIFVPERVI